MAVLGEAGDLAQAQFAVEEPDLLVGERVGDPPAQALECDLAFVAGFDEFCEFWFRRARRSRISARRIAISLRSSAHPGQSMMPCTPREIGGACDRLHPLNGYAHPTAQRQLHLGDAEIKLTLGTLPHSKEDLALCEGCNSLPPSKEPRVQHLLNGGSVGMSVIATLEDDDRSLQVPV